MDKKYAGAKTIVPLLLLLASGLSGCGPEINSYNSDYPNGWTRSQYGYNVVGYGVSSSPYRYSYSSYNYPSFYSSPWAYGSYHTTYPNRAFTSVHHSPYTIYPNYSPYSRYKVYNSPVYYQSGYSHPVVTPSYYGGYKGFYH